MLKKCIALTLTFFKLLHKKFSKRNKEKKLHSSPVTSLQRRSMNKKAICTLDVQFARLSSSRIGTNVKQNQNDEMSFFFAIFLIKSQRKVETLMLKPWFEPGCLVIFVITIGLGFKSGVEYQFFNNACLYRWPKVKHFSVT